jgi:hypothetical protein
MGYTLAKIITAGLGGTIVIAGLDPAIHHLRKTLAKMDGCAGQARA